MAQEGADWTADLLDRLDHVIEVVRSNTTDRLVKVARLVVFGLIAAVVGLMALILLVIAAIRFLDVVLPRSVWLPDVLLGAIFLGAGLFLWSKRTAPAVQERGAR
jgi:protein-S-isoprenylcysteine O-methyltransferase Ste14